MVCRGFVVGVFFYLTWVFLVFVAILFGFLKKRKNGCQAFEMEALSDMAQLGGVLKVNRGIFCKRFFGCPAKLTVIGGSCTHAHAHAHCI